MQPETLGIPAESHNTHSDKFRIPITSVQISDDLRSRFWLSVDRAASCWLWTGARSANGYGVVSIGRVSWYAHRWAWVLTHGSIPDGQSVLHRCDVPACVRPEHLFLGTQLDNMQDAARKGRLHVPRPGRQKVTDAEVSQILALAASGTKQIAIARSFGVSRTFVSLLLRGKRRQHRHREVAA